MTPHQPFRRRRHRPHLRPVAASSSASSSASSATPLRSAPQQPLQRHRRQPSHALTPHSPPPPPPPDPAAASFPVCESSRVSGCPQAGAPCSSRKNEEKSHSQSKQCKHCKQQPQQLLLQRVDRGSDTHRNQAQAGRPWVVEQLEPQHDRAERDEPERFEWRVALPEMQVLVLALLILVTEGGGVEFRELPRSRRTACASAPVERQQRQQWEI